MTAWRDVNSGTPDPATTVTIRIGSLDHWALQHVGLLMVTAYTGIVVGLIALVLAMVALLR